MDVLTCTQQLDALLENFESSIKNQERMEILQKDVEALRFAISLIDGYFDTLVNSTCISVLAAYNSFQCTPEQLNRFRLEMLRLNKAAARKQLTQEDLLFMLETEAYKGQVPTEEELERKCY